MAKQNSQFNFKEQDALDTLSDCGSKIAFLMEVFNAGGPENMEGAAAGLSLVLQGILSDMDKAIQYLRVIAPIKPEKKAA
jgi:hypothetical protein